MFKIFVGANGGFVVATVAGAKGQRRADALRNSAAILEAAQACLAREPDMSLKDIAAAAGVGRVTLYGHYESRAALVDAVVAHAIEQSHAELEQVDLAGDPREAMSRLMAASFDITHRIGGLVVAAQRTLPTGRFQALHEAPAERVRQLLLRGREEGAFRDDAPLSWQVMTIQALIHGAVEAVYRAELTADAARELVPVTVLATLASPAKGIGDPR